MYNFIEFIKEQYIDEAEDPKGKPLKHITHLEDLPHLHGNEGVSHAGNILDDIHTSLSGKVKHSFTGPKAVTHVSEKFDGAPAIIFGRHPQTKKFFVASKSAFNKNPKINYTHEDIEKNHGHSPGLVKKLGAALEHLPKIAPKKGIYHGDIMHTPDDIKLGKKHHEFTPNTITYRVKADSKEGKKAAQSRLGVVVHTKYEGNDIGSLEPSPYVDHENFNEHPDVHKISAQVDPDPKHYSAADRAEFTNHLENAKIHYMKMKPEALDTLASHRENIDRYVNSTIKGGTKPDVESYISHLKARVGKESEQFKTPAKKAAVARKYGDLIQHAQANPKNFEHAFQLANHLQNAKNVLIRTLAKHRPDYEYRIDGKKTGPEGFVAHREGGDPVKLVNRKEFSKLNFNMSKMRRGKPAPINETVRFWKRMNLGKGVTANISRHKPSLTIGSGGFKATLGGQKGSRITAGIPGTGLFKSYYAHGGQDNKPQEKPPNRSFRFLKRVGLGQGASLNLSRQHTPSMSFGQRGARLTLGGKRGTRVSAGIPGTGLFYTHVFKKNKPDNKPEDNVSKPDINNPPNDTVSKQPKPLKSLIDNSRKKVQEDVDDDILYHRNRHHKATNQDQKQNIMNKIKELEDVKRRKEQRRSSALKEAVETHKPVVFALARMNPPTTGHEALINKVHAVAKEHNAHHEVALSHSQDSESNPLPQDKKIKYAKKFFPGTNISGTDKENPSLLQHAKRLEKAGHDHLIMVAGSDRVPQYKSFLNKYNGKDFKFKKIDVVSAGDRDPDSEGVKGMSASKMREHAQNNNYHGFKQGVPSHVSDTDTKALFNDVKKGMRG